MDDYSLPSEVKKCSRTVIDVIESATYKNLEIATKRFVRQSALRLKAGQWLYDVMPTDHYLSGDVGDFKILEEVRVSSLFTPFVEKQVLPPEAKIAVISDIHGDLEALLLCLNNLVEQGYLDDEYRIIQDEFCMVFLGDYTNRRPFSVEVMAVLLYVHSQNIGNVLLLRGNHEYAESNKHMYEHIADVGHHGGVDQETLLGEFARKFDVYYYPDLLYWYDYLPLASYIGCKDEASGQTNFITFCHAGIEVGFNPQQLLISPDTRFQIISRLNRYNAMQKILNDKNLEALHGRVFEVFAYLEKTELKDFVHSYTRKGLIDFTNPQSPRRVRLGMQWNSFLTENHDSGFAGSVHHRNIQMGKKLTEYFFEQWSGPSAKMHAMVRGHQHLNDHDDAINLHNTMLDVLMQRNGCVRQWDGAVYTLGDSSVVTGFHSFMVISLASTVQDWRVQHFYKKAKAKTFEEASCSMLG